MGLDYEIKGERIPYGGDGTGKIRMISVEKNKVVQLVKDKSMSFGVTLDQVTYLLRVPVHHVYYLIQGNCQVFNYEDTCEIRSTELFSI